MINDVREQTHPSIQQPPFWCRLMAGDLTDLETEMAQDHVAAWLNLSHELRTPANAILGHLELLLGGSAGPLTSELRCSLGEIQKAALQLSKQIGAAVTLAEGIPAQAPAKPNPMP